MQNVKTSLVLTAAVERIEKLSLSWSISKGNQFAKKSFLAKTKAKKKGKNQKVNFIQPTLKGTNINMIEKVYNLNSLKNLIKSLLRDGNILNIYGVIGNPINHSLSPFFQNIAFQELGLKAIYIKLLLKNFHQEIIELLEVDKGFLKGFNITVPFKEEILKLKNIDLNKDVKEIGSSNTIKIERNKVEAYNTDWIGFLKALKDSDEHLELANTSVLVLGAGGAAKAIIYALLNENAKVFVWNRSKEKLKVLKEKFNIGIVENLQDIDIKEFKLIVNTTSAYLNSKNKIWLFDYNKISKNQIIFDIEYWSTPLLEEARKKGAKTINGLKMLLYQGVESFKIWTGKEPPVDKMWKALKEAFERSIQR